MPSIFDSIRKDSITVPFDIKFNENFFYKLESLLFNATSKAVELEKKLQNILALRSELERPELTKLPDGSFVDASNVVYIKPTIDDDFHSCVEITLDNGSVRYVRCSDVDSEEAPESPALADRIAFIISVGVDRE